MKLTKKFLACILSCSFLFSCHLSANSVKYKVPIMTVTPPGSTKHIRLEFRDTPGLLGKIKRILDVSELYILHIHANPMGCEELKFLRRKEVYSIFDCIYNRILKRVSGFAGENYGLTFKPLKRNDFVPRFLRSWSTVGYKLDIVRFREFRRSFQVKLRVDGVIHRAIEDYSEDRPMFLEKSHKLLDRLENRLEGFF